MEDWYDVVIFRYLRSVKNWFAIERLRQYSFKTIAYNAMRSAIGNEYKKQRRRAKTVSLYDIIPGTDNMIYMDILVDTTNYFEDIV